MDDFMKKLMGILLLFFFIVTSFVYANNDNLFIGKRIIKDAATILQFGTRVPGTKGSAQTFNYIKQSLGSSTNFSVYTNTFTVKTPIGKKIMHNLWAVINPLKDVRKTVVIAAHYDSKYFTPKSGVVFLGADDGISGVATLLSLGWILKGHHLKHTQVILLFLDGEEAFGTWSNQDSIYGSTYQASYWANKGAIKNLNAFILLDMVGNISSQFCMESYSDVTIMGALFKIAKQLGYKKQFNSKCSGAVEDDHLPFLRYGVKVADIIPNPFPKYWHTAADTLDKLDAQTLTRVFNVVFLYLLQEDYKLKGSGESDESKDNSDYDNEDEVNYGKDVKSRPTTRESYVKSIFAMLNSKNKQYGQQSIDGQEATASNDEDEDEGN